MEDEVWAGRKDPTIHKGMMALLEALHRKERTLPSDRPSGLSEREWGIVRLHFAEGKTRTEVAKVFGLSIERIRMIEYRAVAKMDAAGLIE